MVYFNNMKQQLIELKAIKDISGVWFDVAAEVASYNTRTEDVEIKNLTLSNSYNEDEVIMVEDLAHMPDRFSQQVVNSIEEDVILKEEQAAAEHRQEMQDDMRRSRSEGF